MTRFGQITQRGVAMRKIKLMQWPQRANRVYVLPCSAGSGQSGHRSWGVWLGVWTVFLVCIVMAVAASAQTLTTLVSFDSGNGALPTGMSLVQGRAGNLYGTT